MKINKISTLLFAILMFTATFVVAQERKLLKDNPGATQLNHTEMMDLWARHDVNPTHSRVATNAFPSWKQADATIQVTGDDQRATVKFIGKLDAGSYVAFRFVAPDREPFFLNGFMISETSNWWIDLWNEKFADMWPAGFTKFETIISDGNTGSLSYISADVPVHTCCMLPGPIESFEVAKDGLSISVTGKINEDTLVTLNGEKVPIISYSSIGSTMTLRVPTKYHEGQTILTMATNGETSARVVYIVRSGVAVPVTMCNDPAAINYGGASPCQYK